MERIALFEILARIQQLTHDLYQFEVLLHWITYKMNNI